MVIVKIESDSARTVYGLLVRPCVWGGCEISLNMSLTGLLNCHMLPKWLLASRVRCPGRASWMLPEGAELPSCPCAVSQQDQSLLSGLFEDLLDNLAPNGFSMFAILNI